MDTREWLPYFPELGSEDELADLIGSVSGGFERVPLLQAENRAAAAADTLDRLRNLVRGECAVPGPFVWFVLDLVGGSLASFVDRLDRHPVLASGDGPVCGLLEPLLQRLQDHMIRTLITELHTESGAGQLAGVSPEARFESFVNRLSDTTYQDSFRSRYPMLIEDLARIVDRQTAYLCEVLDAVQTDRPTLGEVHAAVRADDLVVRIGTGNGDLHRRGRSVAVVEFASGARVVYKPRSLEADYAFQELIRRLSGPLGLGLYAPWVLTGESRGWMEFVEYLPLTDEDEMRDYYRKIGYLTALLYASDTCDVHYENIICHRGSPVLVDLETMFHPVLSGESQRGKSAIEKIDERLSRSVTAIGILPTTIGEGAADFDVGGIGFESGQQTPFKGFSFENRWRDDMRISFERQTFEGVSQTPQMSTQSLPPITVAHHVQAGFRKVIDWIIENKHEFISLIEELFSSIEIRYVHNPTFFYSQLLRMCTHPSLLTDPASRHTLLHRVALRRRDSPAAISRAEHRDLCSGDIPYFTLRSDSCELFDSFGQSVGDVLKVAPIHAAMAKITAISAQERDFQHDLIAASFVHKFPQESDQTGFTWPTVDVVGCDDRDERLAEAVRLGDDLLRGMVCTDSHRSTPNWLSAQVSNSEAALWTPGPLDFDCYSGVTGVAYFLAMLGAVSGQNRFTEAALEVYTPLAHMLTEGDLSRDGYSAGAFLGTAGTVYALARAGDVLGEDALTTAARQGLPLLGELLSGDTLLDLIGGGGGVLAVALAMHKIANNSDDRATALAVATSAYRHLAAKFGALNGNPGGETIFSGFAHGVSGVYPYLARLARLSGHREVDAAVGTLLDVQDSMFDQADSDWYTSTLRVQKSYGWCHGAPGILLALCLLENERTGRDLATRIATARDRTIQYGFGNNITYCHGDIGNLEILSFCAEVTNDAELDAQVHTASQALFRSYIDDVRQRSDCRHLYAKSMLVGTSGIGFAFLRSIDNKRVPSLLSLD